ncbi:MAG: TraC family protein, partial [Minisyncoccia bacterium]
MALKAKATQEFIPIKEVRDGVIMLKNEELRAIVLANSVNLSLKSADEQRATILQFQNFLNTLDFSVQISVQSRCLDIRPY